MPSPVGHALGGFAFGWLAARSSRIDRPLLAAAIFAGLGVVPDVDVLVEGTHRLYTHSVAAVGLVALLAAVSLRAVGAAGAGADARGALVVAAAAAYASHLLLDWLGDDRSVPIGIRALWPFTDAYSSRTCAGFRLSNAATGCRDSGPRTCARSAGSCSCCRRWSRSPCGFAHDRDGARAAKRSCKNRVRIFVRDAPRRRAGGAGDRRDTSGHRARRAARRGSPGRRRGR